MRKAPPTPEQKERADLLRERVRASMGTNGRSPLTLGPRSDMIPPGKEDHTMNSFDLRSLTPVTQVERIPHTTGYKVLTEGRCGTYNKEFSYEKNEWIEVKGKPVLCSNGLHFCRRAIDVLEYDNRYWETDHRIVWAFEAAGETIHTFDKSVTTIGRITRMIGHLPRVERHVLWRMIAAEAVAVVLWNLNEGSDRRLSAYDAARDLRNSLISRSRRRSVLPPSMIEDIKEVLAVHRGSQAARYADLLGSGSVEAHNRRGVILSFRSEEVDRAFLNVVGDNPNTRGHREEEDA